MFSTVAIKVACQTRRPGVGGGGGVGDGGWAVERNGAGD